MLSHFATFASDAKLPFIFAQFAPNLLSNLLSYFATFASGAKLPFIFAQFAANLPSGVGGI